MKILATILVLLATVGAVRPDTLQKDPRVTAALNLLEAWLEAEVAYEGIPSVSIAVVSDQDLVWAQSFGYANLAKKVPATPDTKYSICSISKLFTSIGIMRLRDQGEVSLDQPIGEYLPWFEIAQPYKNSRPVTLRGILSHSSGLPRESDFPYWSDDGFPFPTREQVKEQVAKQQMLYPAETFFQYSNLGLTLAGEIVSKASGQSYSSYIEENILAPLEMRDTRTELPESEHGLGFAVGYGVRRPDGHRRAVPYYPVRGIAPAAGFASTVKDLARFASWQFRLLEKGGTEILEANSLREMQRVQWIDTDWDGPARGLGFGIYRHNDKTFVGHGGGCPGYLSRFFIRPKDKIGIIVMINGLGTNPGLYAEKAYDIVASAILDVRKKPKGGRLAPAVLTRYTGKYRNIWGDSAVLVRDDHLVILPVPTKRPLEGLTKLQMVGKDEFRRVRDDGSLAELIRFEVDSEDKVRRMWRHSNFQSRIEEW